MQTTNIPYKPLIVAIVVVLALIIVYLVYSSPQVVALNDTISVYYTGAFTNGTVFGTNIGGEPLNFTVGAGNVITGFDQAVIGMKINETKNVTLSPAEAYGEINPALIVTVPRSELGNQTPTVGMIVTQNSNGQEIEGVVTAVNATTATLNFNPPLAGNTLVFTIKVVAIRRA